MPRKPAKLRQSQPNVCGFYTPEPVRGRVIALHVSGPSNRQIAIQEGIDRETVSRILSQGEVAQNDGGIPIAAPDHDPEGHPGFRGGSVEGDDPRVALAAATKLMEGMRFLSNGAIDQHATGQQDVVAEAATYD